MGARDQMAQIMAGAPNFAYRKTPMPSDLPDLSQGQITQPDVWSDRADKVDQWNIPGQIVKGVAMQPVHAGEAVAEAINDPSIPNMTNAGVQTGAALFQPAKALAALGIGYGAAALKDGNFSLVGSAEAKQKQPQIPDLPGLDPAQMAAYRQAQQDGRSGAMKRFEEISAEYQKGQGRAAEAAAIEKAKAEAEAMKLKSQGEAEAEAMKRSEYERMVQKAEGARDKELAKDRRFSDTEMGKVWDKTGGWGPLLVGAGFGSASRLATGGGSTLKDYGLPALLGGIAGAASNNVPLAYNSFYTEPDNPEKKAYEAYARELPPDHPRKQEWADYAGNLPLENPVRKAAADELYNPGKAAERMLFGAVEGIGGGLGGADLMRIPGRVAEGVAAMPGRVATSAARSGESAATARNSLLETLRKEPQSQVPQGLPTSPPSHPSPEVPQSAPLSAAAQTVQPSTSAPQSLPPLSAPLVDAINGNTTAINDLLTNLNTSKVPVNVGGGGAVQKTSLDDIWASKHSDNARNIIADHLAGGGNIIPKMPAKKGGMPIESLDKQIASAAGGKGVGKHQTGQRLDVLREELSGQGLDITKLTNPQFLEALKRIDPRTFSIPLMMGAGAAGLSGNPRDDMARILAGGS